ncbi:hypothetical protein TNIN_322641 [Trichonephila inaurata madagascariensis]|uniref:Uncharacterized protein n=1 Tax=Trichonephila inaurata madagascariensis TaxID=2747483 RepID=A0A8X6Y3H0_9ARAC|nr:hypothetical protein TNIN_322641 [Trichonephila inaurata madagascariensis]
MQNSSEFGLLKYHLKPWKDLRKQRKPHILIACTLHLFRQMTLELQSEEESYEFFPSIASKFMFRKREKHLCKLSEERAVNGVQASIRYLFKCARRISVDEESSGRMTNIQRIDFMEICGVVSLFIIPRV